MTVTVKLHETEWFAESLPEQLTVVEPTGKAVPEGGSQTTVTQFPVVVGDG
jgi:hypothetical protein